MAQEDRKTTPVNSSAPKVEDVKPKTVEATPETKPFDRSKTYYVQEHWNGFTAGMELPLDGYPDRKLQIFKDEGKIGNKNPII